MLHAPLEALTLSGPEAIATVATGAAAVRVFTDFPITVTEFASSILAPTNRLWIGLAWITGEIESIFRMTCRGLNARGFLMLPRNASATCCVSYGRLVLAPLQQVRLMNNFFSLKSLV